MRQRACWGDAEFLNVDLLIKSKHDLTPLVSALGERVEVLYFGPEHGMSTARFELRPTRARYPTNVREGILGFVKLLKVLTPRARKLWQGAKVRDFAIGIRAGSTYSGFYLEQEVLQKTASLGGQIVFCVYSAITRE